MGDSADLRGDRRAAAAQLRAGQRDQEARGQPRHLRTADRQPRRRALLDVRLQHAAQEHGQLLRRQRGRPREPQRLGCRPEPELLGRRHLRRVQRLLVDLHQRDLLRPLQAVGAGDPQRGVAHHPVPEHQVRDEHALLRRLLHVASGGLQDRRARSAAAGRLRYRELLLVRFRPHPVRGADPPRHGDLAGPYRSRHRRALLGGR